MNRDNNEALTALFKLWAWSADWMTCHACERSLIASRDGEPLRHAEGCESAEHQHPWADLRAAMGPQDKALELFERLLRWRERKDADLLGRARAIVIEHRKGNISLVQRHLGIRYAHATLLLNQLEQAGVVVSPIMDNGGRKVLTQQPGAWPVVRVGDRP